MLTGVDNLTARVHTCCTVRFRGATYIPWAMTGKVTAALEWSIWRSPFSRTKRPHSRQFEFNRIPQSIAGKAPKLRVWSVGLGMQLHKSFSASSAQRPGLEFKLCFYHYHAAKRHFAQIAHSARRRPNANSQGCG